jgi:hypothetical protein
MKYITEKLWREIESLIPSNKGRVGRPEFDNRKALNGIIFILKTGAQWSMMPDKYGIYTTVHGKFIRWCKQGIFQKIMLKAENIIEKDIVKIIGTLLILFIKKLLLLNLAEKTLLIGQKEA